MFKVFFFQINDKKIKFCSLLLLLFFYSIIAFFLIHFDFFLFEFLKKNVHFFCYRCWIQKKQNRLFHLFAYIWFIVHKKNLIIYLFL